MTDSVNPALQILPTPKKRASYRPAALRTNSYARLSSAASPNAASSPGDAHLTRMDSRNSRNSYSPGEVTRSHWTPDSSARTCSACPTTFSFLERKHHCRRCGNIFCSTHSGYTVLLDYNAEFSPTGQSSRSCPRCRRDFELWMNPPNIQRPPTDAASAVKPQKMGRVGAGHGGSSSGSGGTEEDEMRGMPAASVPSDWTWSTF